MAEFGVKATELSAPQGAGARVLPTATEPNIGMNPLVGMVGSVIDVIAKGLQADKKAEADLRKKTIVQAYVTQETNYNEALATGQIDPAKASALSRANFNKFAAGFAEYLPEFKAAGDALRGFTEKGEAENALAAQKAVRDKRMGQAISKGFTFFAGMTPEQEEAQMRAAEAGIKAQDKLEAFYKEQGEARADGRWKKENEDAEAKRLASRLVTDIAGSNIQAFQSFSQGLSTQVRTGKMAPDQAQVLLMERFSNIEGALQAASRANPELASPYRSLFSNMNEVAKKLIDPKSAAEDVKNQFDLLINQSMLFAVTNNNKVRASVAAGRMFPQSVDLALRQSEDVLNTYLMLADTKIDSTTFVPTVVGNPEVEKGVIDQLKTSMDAINKGGLKPEQQAAILSTENAANQFLKQVGEVLNKGASPGQLANVADFLASPEFGKYASTGKLDPAAQKAAATTVQNFYVNKVTPAIVQKLEEPFRGQPTTEKGKEVKPLPLRDYVEVVQSGNGISFAPKNINTIKNNTAQTSAMIAVNDLRQSEKVVNQIIRMGAHMEGSTNYAAFWEKNKHLIMPNVFEAPAKETSTKEKTPAQGGVIPNLNATDRAIAEQFLNIDFEGPANVTRDALQGVFKDFDKLTPAQLKELAVSLKQIGLMKE